MILNLYAAGHPDEALSALQTPVQLNPGSLQAHSLLATVYQQLHRSREATAEWRAALEIDPISSLALEGVAKSLLASNDYAAVIQLLHSAPPDENVALDLAIAYDRAGNLDLAGETLKKAQESAPGSLQLANALDLVDLRQDHHDEPGPPILLRNDTPSANHWLKLRLEGVKSNRSRHWCRVAVRYDRHVQVQEVLRQASYLSSNDPRLHFGLARRPPPTLRCAGR